MLNLFAKPPAPTLPSAELTCEFEVTLFMPLEAKRETELSVPCAELGCFWEGESGVEGEYGGVVCAVPSGGSVRDPGGAFLS